jgi:EIN3-binding F-box protein
VCRGLKELRLVGFPASVQAYHMEHILCDILHYNGIRKVELQSYHFTDTHVCTVARSCQGALQELILDECPNVLGNFVVCLRESCPNLTKLTLNRIGISDVQIRILMLVGFHQLEEFNLTWCWCPLITDRLLAILHASTLPKLKRVNLSDCPNVTQESVDYHQHRWEVEY